MIRSLIALAVLIFASEAGALDTSYADYLIEKARGKKLAESDQWHALLHYDKTLFGGFKSAAKDELFFNSPRGAVSPADEMEATIRSFFRSDERPEGESSQPYRCAFIARYTWLKKELGIDPSRLEEKECGRFNDWFLAINPGRATLIFPSSFLNNPASAFGHTLIRIDQPDQNERTRLLAYTANYAAATGGEGALLYAAKGILGGYPGYFSVEPYYEKVKKYSDIERRDIWEYPLNLTREEIDIMLMHLWELRGISFPYYYFDENCSYHLLSLIEAARPSLKLRSRFRGWVLPLDTVRVLEDAREPSGEAVFRPSLATKLQARIAESSAAERAIAKKLAASDGEEGLLPETFMDAEKARVLDLSHEYLNYRILSGKEDSPPGQKRALMLLKERSLLNAPKSAPAVPVPPVSPEQGHRSARAGIGAGRENGRWFYDLRVRPAYHDLLDPIEGYTDGAQIQIFNTVFRHREEESPVLHELDFVEIMSLSPRNEFLSPFSWALDSGLKRTDFPDHYDSLTFKTGVSAGISGRLPANAAGYALINTAAELNKHFDHEYALGPGIRSGLFIDFYDWWRINIDVRANYFAAGDEHSLIKGAAEQRFTLGADRAIRISYSHERRFGKDDNTAALSFDLYF